MRTTKRTTNHCLHGETINDQCLACEVVLATFEMWLDWPAGSIDELAMTDLIEAANEKINEPNESEAA